MDEDRPLTAFSLTLIVNGAGMALPALSSLLRSLHSLLRETEFQLRGTSRIEWLAGEVISGFSEDDQQRRLAIELRATAECQELVDGLCSMLAGLRSGSFPEAGRWKSILSHVLVLARYVEQEVVSEMWLSQPGETPVYVTSDTFGHASQLIRELSV
ncbi:MAG: hypothetical protein H7A35_06470 [Planctomycetales bacterium]|nr:hypothetical protein [bacterium]UNM09701.1 MAG: hypothetical protein H7A35_06470 [Planctomycetales bacterium]